MTASPTRRIAILASSGGNLRSHGGDDPAKLILDAKRQIEAAGFELVLTQFVAAGASMDTADDRTPAQLWTLEDGQPTLSAEGSLAEVNAAARVLDAEIAAAIEEGGVDGLILMSADPTDTNSAAVAAAVAADVPAAGTGGTSIAKAQQLGLRLVGASGTTGTTSVTRSVAYVSALAKL